MTYYYLCSTLPMLSFDGNMPFSVQDFVNDCQRQLTDRDFQDLVRAVYASDGNAQNALLRQWQEFQHCLHNEIAALRAQKKGFAPTNNVRGQRGYDSDVASAVNEAMREKNILESERALLKAQWDYIEQISLNTLFEKEYVFAYGLKLTILEQLSAFRSSEGQKQFEVIKTSVLQEIQK